MDGWSDKVKEITEEVLENARKVQYEIENLNKGSYTCCENLTELAEYFNDLAEGFKYTAKELVNLDDEEDEEDEDEEVDESYRPRRRRFLNED